MSELHGENKSLEDRILDYVIRFQHPRGFVPEGDIFEALIRDPRASDIRVTLSKLLREGKLSIHPGMPWDPPGTLYKHPFRGR